MPQAKTPTEDKAEDQAVQGWAELVKRATEGESSGAKQVRRAIVLEQQISTLREKVNDNRTYLRLMDRNDELTEDQSEFTEVFYPEKEKGERRDADEVTATRRAREFARKNGSS